MRTSLQDTTILYANLPLLTCIYGALWTPFFLFDATVKAEAFDLGMVRAVLMEYYADLQLRLSIVALPWLVS